MGGEAVAEGTGLLSEVRPTGSAAAPCVAFPAELLAAGRDSEKVTDYLGAALGGSRGSERQAEAHRCC